MCSAVCCVQYSVQFLVFLTVCSIQYSVQYSVPYAVCSIVCSLQCVVQCAAYSVQCVVCSTVWCTVHCTVCNVHCSGRSAMCRVQYKVLAGSQALAQPYTGPRIMGGKTHHTPSHTWYRLYCILLHYITLHCTTFCFTALY